MIIIVCQEHTTALAYASRALESTYGFTGRRRGVDLLHPLLLSTGP